MYRNIVPESHGNRNWLHGVGSSNRFGVQPTRPSIPPPESNPWWWNPGKVAIERPNYTFRDRCERFDPNVEVVKDGYTKKWNVFAKTTAINTPICSGWRLLFIVDYPSDAVFERLISARFGNLSPTEYFDRIAAKITAEKAAAEKKFSQDSMDKAMESFDHSQIKVSMYGKSSGSKFSTYHS